MPLPSAIEIIEVGPREGFQYEGIGRPEAILVADKLRLIAALAKTGLRTIQIVSFVNPKIVPQMADALEILTQLQPVPGIAYTGIHLNDSGLKRALTAPNLTLVADLVLSASEAFALRNQKRDLAGDADAARAMGEVYREHGLAVTTGNIMAAFGCNFEGPIATERVLERAAILQDIAIASGGALNVLNLADTMGWADPAQIVKTISAVRERFPATRISLHLHDTRGLAIANVMAALECGVDRFETAIGGLGGCPFAGLTGAAGNVATEEVALLCQRLGIATGLDLPALLQAAAVAEDVVGHRLASRLAGAGLPPNFFSAASPVMPAKAGIHDFL
jgi:hydroxymethylglutaryl-CoA lyase